MTQRDLPEEVHRGALQGAGKEAFRDGAGASRDDASVALSARAQPQGLRGPWIQTYSGLAFPLLEPRPEHVHLRDISEALSKICRFTGHTRWPYSVAQHSLFVADMIRAYGRLDAEPYGLLHDAKETYVGDIATPIKKALALVSRADAGVGGAASIGSALDQLEEPIDQAIHQRFGLDWPPPDDVQAIVRHCDLMALATERRDILLDGPASEHTDWGALPAPAALRIDQQPWHWLDAAERFHQRAVKLGLLR